MKRTRGAREFLLDYVRMHNLGVETGDFRRVAELFGRDGHIAFSGIDIGPFVGNEAIAAAFKDMPPTDELQLGSVTGHDRHACAEYGWARKPRAYAGRVDTYMDTAGVFSVHILRYRAARDRT